MTVRFPIFFTEKAIRDLDEFTQYIAGEGYPETALSYTDRIYSFCKTLGDFPLKHKACQKKGFKRFHYRCALFEKRYVVAYRVEKNQTLVIKRVVHGMRLT